MRTLYEDDTSDTDLTFTVPGASILASTHKIHAQKKRHIVKVQANDLNGGEPVWISQEAIHADSEIWNKANAGPGKLVVRQAYARKKGWLKPEEV